MVVIMVQWKVFLLVGLKVLLMVYGSVVLRAERTAVVMVLKAAATKEK